MVEASVQTDEVEGDGNVGEAAPEDQGLALGGKHVRWMGEVQSLQLDQAEAYLDVHWLDLEAHEKVHWEEGGHVALSFQLEDGRGDHGVPGWDAQLCEVQVEADDQGAVMGHRIQEQAEALGP